MNARLFRGKTARKLLSCILSASILCSLLPVGAFAAQVSNTAEAAPTQNVVYEDIENHWGKEQILTWSEYGVFAGYNGKFCPDDPITRGELAVVINAVMDYQTKSSDVTFKDLDEAFYTDPILRLAEAGVMCGAYGLVRPKDNVTREETAVMLCKAFGLTPETVKTKFVDQDAISDWAVGSVSAMKNRGYVAGTPAGEFRPGASVTRAEVAAMLSGCVAAYITEQGSYSVEETGIVIVKSSSVTISNSTLSDNIIASGKVTADGSVLLKNTTVAGEMIAISGNEKVFQVENTTTGGSSGGGGGGGGSTPIAPIDLKAVEEDQHVLDIQGGTITVADGTSIYELTKGIENLDGYDYNVTNSAGEAKSGDLETGDVLTVTTEPGKTYTIEVLPRTAVTGIQLSETTLSMKEGDVKQLEAVVSPADATDSRILWATSNARVANMENGVVTATGAGTATLTATTMDGSFVASCEVTVTEALVNVESLEIGKESITLAPGEAGQLGVIVHPEFADNTAVTWSSSNPNVAAVQDGGFVKAAAAGTAVITNEGYVISDVLVDGSSVGAVSSYTFKKVISKHTITAVFEKVDVEESGLPFTDVKSDDWYHDAVEYVYGEGLMAGTSGKLFTPNGTLSRGMIVQILYSLEGKPETDADSVFDDVKAGAWYADAVNWAASVGVVSGYGNGKFGPDDSITREQLAAILRQYAGLKGYKTEASGELDGFADADQVSGWATEAMQWAVSNGLMSGKNGGMLDPKGTATRAETAVILMQFCEKIAE